MKSIVSFFVRFAVIVGVLAAAAYWLSYFFAATGKRFCFLFGNALPDDSELPKKEEEPAPSCGCEDAVCAVDMCMPF